MTKAVLFSSNVGDINADMAFINNLGATTNPAVTDDSGDGYSSGSLWVNTATDAVYICTDATVGAAVWVLTGLTGISPTEIAYLDGALPGTVVNSKAAVYSAAGLLARSSAAPAAAGTIQGDATALTAELNAVTGADGTTGVILQTAAANLVVFVLNTNAASVLKVYPATGAQINALGANNAISIGPGQLGIFIGRSATLWYCSGAATITPTTAQIDLLAQGVAGGYKIARGVHQQAAASDTIATGLATVVAACVSWRDAPTLKQMFLTASIGNQSGAPAAGSILINSYKPTANIDVTPTPSTDFTENLSSNWIAIGT